MSIENMDNVNMNNNKKKVSIFSDGSARNNPGPGGFGCVLEYVDSSGKLHKLELSGAYGETTNNRMELMGVIAALEVLKVPCEVMFFTDSSYIVNAFNKDWIKGWKAKNWKNAQKKPVKNRDLWERLLRATRMHSITWVWVKGHAGHPQNERCDYLATRAADTGPYEIDKVFENENRKLV